MAEGRFLSRSVSTNAQLADVSIEAALLFSWCIPHLDVEGRLRGDPLFIKSNIVPHRNEITLKRIPRLLHELGRAVDDEGVPLVVWYETGRRVVLAFPGFEGQQKGLRKGRETPSKLPPLTEECRIIAGGTPEEIRQWDGFSPAQVEVEVKGEVEGEVKASAAPAFNLGPYIDVYRERFQADPPTARTGAVLKRMERKHTPPEVLRRWAIFVAAKGELGPEYFERTWSEWAAVPTGQARRNGQLTSDEVAAGLERWAKEHA